MTKIFLAYNSMDSTKVERLARRLRAGGIDFFFDRWDLVPGRPWQEGIENAMRECAKCAMLLGNHGLGSWQTEETLTMMRAHDMEVDVVLLPGADLAGFAQRIAEVDELPAGLLERSAVDLEKWLADLFRSEP